MSRHSTQILSRARLVLSPKEPLRAGGPAEELERRIQDVFRSGYLHVLVDLRAVPSVDSAGIRALVRGHTTAQRLGRRFSLLSPNAKVRSTLDLSMLGRVLDIHETVVEAKSRVVRWDLLTTGAAVAVIGLGLVAIGLSVPGLGFEGSLTGGEPLPSALQATDGRGLVNPLVQLAKLVAAAVIGMLVTVVHRKSKTDRASSPAMDQAQVLLCVSGAMMMIIIGNSLARAFGIAGAASIIRFRTPVEDARDITVLFLLMGLGMAAGLGALGVAGLGTVFLCTLLPLLNLFSAERPRTMLCEIEADGREFPTAHVHQVFAVNSIVFEPREVSQGDEATVRYLTSLRETDSLEDLSAQLISDGSKGIKNVSWSPPKRA